MAGENGRAIGVTILVEPVMCKPETSHNLLIHKGKRGF
jgi:hypothetical protein